MRHILIIPFICGAALSAASPALAAKYESTYQQYPGYVAVGPKGVAARPPVECQTTTKKSTRWLRTTHSTTTACAVD